MRLNVSYFSHLRSNFILTFGTNAAIALKYFFRHTFDVRYHHFYVVQPWVLYLYLAYVSKLILLIPEELKELAVCLRHLNQINLRLADLNTAFIACLPMGYLGLGKASRGFELLLQSLQLFKVCPKPIRTELKVFTDLLQFVLK